MRNLIKLVMVAAAVVSPFGSQAALACDDGAGERPRSSRRLQDQAQADRLEKALMEKKIAAQADVTVKVEPALIRLKTADGKDAVSSPVTAEELGKQGFAITAGERHEIVDLRILGSMKPEDGVAQAVVSKETVLAALKQAAQKQKLLETQEKAKESAFIKESSEPEPKSYRYRGCP